MRTKIKNAPRWDKLKDAESFDKRESMNLPRLQIGDDVEKFGGSYGGPGRIVSKFPVNENEWRFIVSHKIEGGYGKLLHIYTAGQLRKLPNDRGATCQASTKEVRRRNR
jgi:hypothetical protein